MPLPARAALVVGEQGAALVDTARREVQAAARTPVYRRRTTSVYDRDREEWIPDTLETETGLPAWLVAFLAGGTAVLAATAGQRAIRTGTLEVVDQKEYEVTTAGRTKRVWADVGGSGPVAKLGKRGHEGESSTVLETGRTRQWVRLRGRDSVSGYQPLVNVF